MLLSMTGHGEACRESQGRTIAVELRTVNNRYLKISTRITEGYGGLESQIEAVLKQQLRRGSVQVNVRVERQASPDDFRLNSVALASYRRQLQKLCSESGFSDSIHLESLLALPGVVDETAARCVVTDDIWTPLEDAIREALESLLQMRRDEGAAMATDLTANCASIASQLEKIEQRSPEIQRAYEGRLVERVNKLLAEHDVRIENSDIVREVCIYADRCDISEETVRLRSHLDQFAAIVSSEESAGRKLEFLIQEFLRETNTIGSKANDAEIARHVVEIKTAIERMREMIQNVE